MADANGPNDGGEAASDNRRKRRAPDVYQDLPTADVRDFRQALKNSLKDTQAGGELHIPRGPVFYPTIEDFQGNPIDYVEKIRPVAEKYGIAKIVPPKGWNPSSVFAIDLQTDKTFETKHQMLNRLQEGISFSDGFDYTPSRYQVVASERAAAWKAANYGDYRPYTVENLERDYWDIVETAKEVAVEYGNDINSDLFGSGFPRSERGRSIYGTKDPAKVDLPEPEFGTADYYKETWWNLNNIPSAPDSVLRHVRVGIHGINVPWVYFGSLFSTFCWHNEDNYLYSMNYHHSGAPKHWYGVPGAKRATEGVEKVFRSFLSLTMRDVPDLLHHITTMFSPKLLQNSDVPVHKLVQHEGEFIITFPRAFHGGFSLGPNIGEAVNFATHDWIAYGSDANERYRSFARPAVFSHDRLTFTMANHLEDQKSYKTCKLLLDELQRVVKEEISLRSQLRADGVRDVSDQIKLPKNRLDQLDETSANYDDKRCCHGCKHVCFFSAVGCECSQSKVSCLRHSHFMCRCPTSRRYFMIWSTEADLTRTVDKVRKHCQSLREQEDVPTPMNEDSENSEPPDVAPGSETDLLMHKSTDVPTTSVPRRLITPFSSSDGTSTVVAAGDERTAIFPPESVPIPGNNIPRMVSEESSR